MTGIIYQEDEPGIVVSIDGERIGRYADMDHARRAVQAWLGESVRIAQFNIGVEQTVDYL
jgi:hypothetical protein